MELLHVVKQFANIKNFVSQVDVYNFKILPTFILACSLLMTCKQYLMKPIACYTANLPSGSGMESYIENFCYTTEKYFVGVNKLVHANRLQNNIYIWFPLILLLQAISLNLPKLLWNYFGRCVDYCYIRELCQKARLDEGMIKKLIIYLQMQRLHLCGSSGILVAYMLTRVILISIVFLNMLFLLKYLFSNDTFLPLIIVHNFITGNTTQPANSIFSATVFCELDIRHLSKMNNFYSQCTLPANMLYEKLFSIVWLFLIISLAATLFDVSKSLMYLIFKRRIISYYLKRDVKNFYTTINMNLYFEILLLSQFSSVIARNIFKNLYHTYAKGKIV